MKIASIQMTKGSVSDTIKDRCRITSSTIDKWTWGQKMTTLWYETADADAPLTQGDFIEQCPLISWKPSSTTLNDGDEKTFLQDSVVSYQLDVVVMTQACDIEHEKFPDMILCPYVTISTYKSLWKQYKQQEGESPTDKAWKRIWEELRKGFTWQHALLGDQDPACPEHIIVNFSEIYSAPRSFLESLLRRRKQKRLRLLPPYREHLSQAFARFFMRVGLPTPIKADPP